MKATVFRRDPRGLTQDELDTTIMELNEYAARRHIRDPRELPVGHYVLYLMADAERRFRGQQLTLFDRGPTGS